MALFRNHVDFSRFIDGSFTDFLVHVDNGQGEVKTFNTHKLMLAGTSRYFASYFEANEAAADMTLKMHPVHFEAVLQFIYAGHAIVAAEDTAGVMEALTAFELVDILAPTASAKSEPADADNVAAAVEPEPSSSSGPPRKKIKTEKSVKGEPEDKKPTVDASSAESELEIRRLVRFNRGTGKHHCTICHKGYSSQWIAADHINAKHLERQVFRCPFCSESFKSSGQKRNHVYLRHRTENTLPSPKPDSEGEQQQQQLVRFNRLTGRYSCGFCDQEYARKSTAADHVNAKHFGVQDFRCQFCPETFSSGAQKRNHVFLKHQKENKEAKLMGAAGLQ